MDRAFIVLIFTAAIARFFWLESSPPGFYIDEAAVATHALCLAEKGTSAQGERFVLLFPTFMDGVAGWPIVYLSAAWSKIFGTSVYSLRAVAGFIVLITLFAFYRLTLFYTDRTTALFALLSGTVMPWAFNSSRVAWDQPTLPCFILLALWVGLTRNGVFAALVSAFCFSAAAYAYSPGRFVVLCLLPLLLLIRYRERRLTWQFATALCVGCALFLTPLAYGVLKGGLNARFQMLSIFTPHQLELAFGSHSPLLYPVLLLRNILYHLSPSFLWLHGDSNLRHSTQVLGQLSWLDAVAFLGGGITFLCKKREKPGPLFSLAITGVIIGITPAAMTWESIPHALRSSVAWPFFAILSGLGMRTLYERFSFSRVGLFAMGTLSLCLLLYAYRGSSYPERAKIWFDWSIKEYAEKGNADWEMLFKTTKDYQPLSLRYYVMHYGKQTCDQSRQYEPKH